mmetsp:Transcript_8151/g.9318  ORF Transcript_8151/g.9318 Transcript_8151/m.9318 type:complete len:159 (-) Transcript_8151:872-1348(-)
MDPPESKKRKIDSPQNSGQKSLSSVAQSTSKAKEGLESHKPSSLLETSKNTISDKMHSPQVADEINFNKELASVMYGFGDVWNPLPETIELMNRIVIEYIEEMTRASLNAALKGKLTVPCLLYALRHQQQKYNRVNQLIKMNKELNKHRKMTKEPNVN